MKIEQVSVFLENQPGRLMAVLEVLGNAGISIRALSVSDTSDFGIVRMVLAGKASAAVEILKKAGFTTRLDWVLGAEIPDVAGGLLKTVVQPLARAGVNLRYFYAYVEPDTRKAMAVIKPDDVEKAEKALQAK